MAQRCWDTDDSIMGTVGTFEWPKLYYGTIANEPNLNVMAQIQWEQ